MGQKAKNAGSKKRSPPKTVKRISKKTDTYHYTPEVLRLVQEMWWNSYSSLNKTGNLPSKKERQQMFEQCSKSLG
jgi:hypothetical protein